MLQKGLKDLAELYALKAIDFKDVENLSGITRADMPADFFKYADAYGAAHDAHCAEQEALAVAKKILQQGADFDIDKHHCTFDGKPCLHSDEHVCFFCKLV